MPDARRLGVGEHALVLGDRLRAVPTREQHGVHAAQRALEGGVVVERAPHDLVPVKPLGGRRLAHEHPHLRARPNELSRGLPAHLTRRCGDQDHRAMLYGITVKMDALPEGHP